MKEMREKSENKIGSGSAKWFKRAIALCMSILVLCSSVKLEVFANPVGNVSNQEEVERKAMDEELEALKEKQWKLEEEYEKERKEHKKEEEERLKLEELENKRVVRAGTADVPWNGEVADSFAGGSGTVEDPYQISNVEELAYMLLFAKKNYWKKSYNYIITNDIYINKKGNRDNEWYGYEFPVQGCLDGNGHTIYGIYNSELCQGGDPLIIKNLSIENAYYDSENNGIGFAGFISSLENCSISGMVNISNEVKARYIIGCLVGKADQVISCKNNMNVYANIEGTSVAGICQGAEICKDCVNYGNLSGDEVCGIVGAVGPDGSIINCANYGEIKGNCSSGIVGEIGDSSSDEIEEISGCTNYGKIDAIEDAAGITAYFSGSAYIFANNDNEGDIKGENRVGGIIASFVNGGDDKVCIRNCSNKGILSGAPEIGGIIGKVDLSSFRGESLELEKCINYSDIYTSNGNGTSVESKYFSHAGGIVALYDGWCEVSNLTIKQCVNYGNINHNVEELQGVGGGILGGNSYSDGNVKIIQCCNNGDLTATSVESGRKMGGIVGELKGTVKDTNSIEECYNYGRILAGYCASGIVGESENISIFNCYNAGDLKAKISSGICMSSGYEDDSYIENCYNIGKVKNTYYDGGSSGVYFQISNLYDYDGDALSRYGNVTYLTKTQMKEQSNFKGFDFESVWKMGDSSYPYPILQNTTFVSPIPDNLSVEAKDGETAIQVTDPKGHAIKGATVKSTSTAQEQETTDTGLAKFTNLSGETETFTVTAAGYPSKTESFDLEKCGHLCKIVMVKDGLSKVTLTYNGNKYNLLVEEKKINEEDKNTKFRIQCEAVENTKENIGKYTIEQEKKQGAYNKIAESEDGSFSLQTNNFQAEKQVYVCGYDKSNKELFRTQINLHIIKAAKKTEVTKINLGKDLSFTVGDDVPILGGRKITLNGLTALPVYTEVDDETIKVGFNVDLGKFGTDDKTKKRKWQGMKETFKKSLLGRGDSVFEDIRKYSDKEYKMSKNLGITAAVAGYAEGPVTGETLSGKIYICIQVSWGKEWQACKLPPIVVALDLTGEVSGGGESTLQVEPFEVEGNVFAEGMAEGKLSAGMGIKHLGSAGAYGKVGTSIKYIVFPKVVNGFEYWKLSGEFGLQFRAFGKERGSLKIMDGEYYVYKRDASTKRAAAGLQENDSKNIIAALTDQDSYTTIPHEQLAPMEENVDMSGKEMTVSENSVSENSVSGNTLEAGSSPENEEIDVERSARTYASDGILADDWFGSVAVDKANVDSVFVQTSSYIDSMPQLVSSGEDVVMLYLDDCPTRNAQNASTLMYSLYNEQDNTWSMPQAVYDDGTADYNPTVCKKENGFYVMWNNGKTVVPDGEELSLADTAGATDLYRMNYDAATHTFTNGKAVTWNGTVKENGMVENGIYEKAAAMAEKSGKNYYTWIENSAGNVFGTEGTNRIILAEDTEGVAKAMQIADINKPVLDLKLGTVNDKLYLAYTCDKDGDISDTSDTGLVILDVTDGIGAEQIIYEGSIENIQFNIYNGEKALLWHANGNYFMWNGAQVSALFDEGEIVGSSFQYFTGDEGKQYIGYIGSDEAGLNGYLMQYDTDSAAWGRPVQITETENYIEQLNSIAWNGRVLSAYNLVKADVGQGDSWIQSCSLGSVLTGEYCDLSIVNANYVSGDFQRNTKFPVTLCINNCGTKMVESVKVSLLNSQKQIVTETDIPVKLLPGNSQEIECNLDLPSDIENGTYYFSVEKNQISCPERNESDNSYEAALGMTDIETAAHLNRVNGYYSIVASLVNKGLKAGKVRLIIKNYKTGEEYYSEDVENLAAGESYHLEIPIQWLDIPEEKANAVSVQAVSEDGQEIEGNNEAYVNIIPYSTEEAAKEPEPSPEKKEEKLPDDEKEKGPATQQKIAVSKITISGISKKIAAGKKIQLTANIVPKNASDKNVTWHSSNKKYATVSSKGKVSVKKAGIGKNVTITATARDGSNVKATYKIKIMKNVVKKVTIKSSKKTVKAGKNLKLKAVVKTSGKSANTKIKWTSSNTKYATVTSKGVVKAKKAGKEKTVKITAGATDGSGKKGTIKIKIQ